MKSLYRQQVFIQNTQSPSREQAPAEEPRRDQDKPLALPPLCVAPRKQDTKSAHSHTVPALGHSETDASNACMHSWARGGSRVGAP